jgi:phosphoenolpyruvate carboxykinase (GTP)
MLIPPATMPGYKIHTVGEDIAWLHPGADGRLWAINPEAGFFGVAPGTSAKTNANALTMLSHDTIFTNVALTADDEPWWEGKSDEMPAFDWRGQPYEPGNGLAAHPNSRFTVAARQCPSYDLPAGEDPRGVPISAIIFGGRRAELAPLVFEARDWRHGVLVGASLASETTAAATGAVGQVRRDPMAMKPFCGYNFADYWAHWLSFADRSNGLPKIFHVNWFRQNEQGRFIWPGFGENLRVLKWILERCEDKAGAVTTPIGYLPSPDDLPTAGLNLDAAALRSLLAVDKAKWPAEMAAIGEYFASFGECLPRGLWDEYQRVVRELQD